MKRYLLTALMLFAFIDLNAQVLDTKSTEFLDWFFNTQRKVSNGKNFYLANGISENEIKKLTTYINADTLIHLSQSIQDAKSPRYLVLSDTQKEYLLNLIQKIKLKPIPNNMLPNMQLMDSVQFNSIFKNSKYYETWDNAYKSKIYGYYSFNTPIFFGPNYCLFKYNYSCGWLCGDGKTIIYRKTKRGWERWIELDNWIS